MTKLTEINIEDFIKGNTITDKEKIRVATCMPKSVPESFLQKELIPIGVAKFKGDSMPKQWSVNEDFRIGKLYPIYDGENGEYPISDKTGKGMKMTPKAWSVKYF
ncbi:MAG: hypothetical protein M0R03_16400 [Novosphingobium sp.]|nr:hypothetical protein [Novosphingobium sp.]